MLIAGVDEVGRGPLAGPVVTAAVILNDNIKGLADSKTLTAKKREELKDIIVRQSVCYAYGRAEVEEIAELNIHHATLLAMKRAIEGLAVKPDKVLIDGAFTPPEVAYDCYAIVKGDTFIPEISAAGILAKVSRDNEMCEMDKVYQGYNFSKHKGYATKEHIMCLKKIGPSSIHRAQFIRSFIREAVHP